MPIRARRRAVTDPVTTRPPRAPRVAAAPHRINGTDPVTTRLLLLSTVAALVAVLVGCGAALGGQELRVVDPETGVPCAPGRVGELWLRGPSVADGYWQ